MAETPGVALRDGGGAGAAALGGSPSEAPADAFRDITARLSRISASFAKGFMQSEATIEEPPTAAEERDSVPPTVGPQRLPTRLSRPARGARATP